MLDLKTKFLISSCEDDENYILIYDRKFDLNKEKKIISFFCPNHNVYIYHSPDSAQGDIVFCSARIAGLRIETLNKIKNSKKCNIILTNKDALLNKVIAPRYLENFYFSLSVGDKFDAFCVSKVLYKLGYNKCYNAYNSGEYASRGEILDIITAGKGYRIELNFDKILSIKRFDCDTQLSFGDCVSNVEIYSASEVIFDEDINLSLAEYKGNDERIKKFIESGSRFFCLDGFLTSIVKSSNCVGFFDHCKGYSILSDENDNVDFIGFSDIKKNRFVSYKKIIDSSFFFLPPRNFFLESKIANFNLEQKFKDYFFNSDFKNVIVARNTSSLKRVESFLLEGEFSFKIISNVNECNEANCIFVSLLELDVGFIFSNFHVFTEVELFGKKYVEKSSSKDKLNEQLLYELQENDFIVHEDYGIAKLLGIEKIKVADSDEKDFISLVYANNNKLFLPVENINKIRKYKDKDSEFVTLDSLGGTRWKSCKERARQALKDVSEKLMKISATRATVKVRELDYDENLYRSFCQEFKFCETEGQLGAILDIEQDIENRVLIDRLICGGVGFGKTEVAMRAACIFVLAGYQVAVVAPTTILSRQNFLAFSARFKNFGIKVSELSGMIAAKDVSETKRKIKLKETDIVVGTHAIFSRQIDFADLGLLIIDEEQSFGVKQKELLKEKYPQINVISLSATPIPRTLNMSLSGIKDISIIDTAPQSKASTEVFVLEKEDKEIINFINEEIKKSGQVFYISPRIKDLDKIFRNLSQEIPSAQIKIAHGKMKKSQLEIIMKGFYEGKFNVLLSTSIVEAGVHIPNANTMIINDANLFGLSQLYQLIGRVGRSSVKGNAVLVVANNIFRDNKAISRLTMLKNKSIMSGHMSIAMYDMDERGTGSLIGHEQSGNLKEAIGVEMYRDILSEEIEKIKSGKDCVKCFAEVEIDLDAFIPESYIEDSGLRLVFYRRLAEAKSDLQIEEIISEISDRFGACPTEVINLSDILKLKIICSNFSIRLLKKIGDKIKIEFNEDKPHNASKLIEFVKMNSNVAKLTPSGSFLVKINVKKSLIVFLQWLLHSIC